MSEVRHIPYSEWSEKVRLSCLKGRHCQEFLELKQSAPSYKGTDYEQFVFNELAKLETELIKDTIKNYQKAMNKCFDELDLHFFARGLKELKLAIDDCLFFDEIELLSIESEKKLKSEIYSNYTGYFDKFSRYVDKMEKYETDQFVREFVYMYRKAHIDKYIQERTSYE